MNDYSLADFMNYYWPVLQARAQKHGMPEPSSASVRRAVANYYSPLALKEVQLMSMKEATERFAQAKAAETKRMAEELRLRAKLERKARRRARIMSMLKFGLQVALTGYGLHLQGKEIEAMGALGRGMQAPPMM